MKSKERIGFYYGVTPSFPYAIREARRRWPEAEITAIIPLNYSPDEVVVESVDEFLLLERSGYSPLHPFACMQVMKALRYKRFDRFVTLFKTPQQRILAVISGASRAETWCVDGRILPMETTWADLLRGALRRQLGGRLRYWKLWWYARLVWVRRPR